MVIDQNLWNSTPIIYLIYRGRFLPPPKKKKKKTIMIKYTRTIS